MKCSLLILLLLLSLASSIHSLSVIRPTLVYSYRQKSLLWANGLPNDDGADEDPNDDLNEEWTHFQKENLSNKTATSSSSGIISADNLFEPRSAETINHGQQVDIAVSFLVAIVCIGGVFLIHSPNGFITDATGIAADPMILEDVDSAKGRFEALTGGLWF